MTHPFLAEWTRVPQGRKVRGKKKRMVVLELAKIYKTEKSLRNPEREVKCTFPETTVDFTFALGAD